MLEVAVEKCLGAFALTADFAVPGRGVTALFGRSGAGKTTLVNLLAGLARPARARVLNLRFFIIVLICLLRRRKLVASSC